MMTLTCTKCGKPLNQGAVAEEGKWVCHDCFGKPVMKPVSITIDPDGELGNFETLDLKIKQIGLELDNFRENIYENQLDNFQENIYENHRMIKELYEKMSELEKSVSTIKGQITKINKKFKKLGESDGSSD